MPPRYNQGQLVSPVTGTPGFDQSAGAEAAAIAKADDQSRADLAQQRSQEAALNMQRLQDSEQNFMAAAGAFRYIQAQNEANQRRLEAQARAEQEEQRKLQVQFDRINEDDRLGAAVEALKGKYTAQPDLAVSDFKKQIPAMRAQFQQRYQEDPERLRMLMGSQREQELQALNNIQSWARTTTNQNLDKKLQLLPEELGLKIEGLKGGIGEQMEGYLKAVNDVNGIYNQMWQSNPDAATKDGILIKRLNLNHEAAKKFTDHLIAQTPEGEAGMAHLDQVTKIVQDANFMGLGLSDADKKSTLEHLHSQRNVHEQDVIISIKGDNDIAVLDTNRLKMDLYKAANDPRQMQALAVKIQGQYKDLDQRIAAVGKEPDSKIKNAKLAGLKAQQNALISEAGQDLKLERGFDQLQRTLTTFAQGQLKFQQGQALFQQSQARLLQGIQQKAVDEKKAASTQAFNAEWGKIMTGLNAVFAEPAGSKQQEKVSKIINETIPKLNDALFKQSIDIESFDKYNKQLKKYAGDVAGYKTKPPGWFGLGGGTVKLKGPELAKAEETAQAQYAQAVKQNADNFVAMESSIETLATLTTSKLERTALTQYMTANLPTLLDSAGYKKLSPVEQSKKRSNAIRKMVEDYRKGELK